MKIVLLGAPGAGKGTHAQYLSDRYGIPHISTGDIFRAKLKAGSFLGLIAKGYTDRGELVPDELTVDFVLDRLAAEDCQKGYILDGFPRNLSQAEALSKALAERNEDIDCALHFEISEEEILRRMNGRRVCPACGASYNLAGLLPLREGICDRCGSEIIQRDDDRPETVLRRLEVYRQQTAPIVDYYRAMGKEISVDSGRSLKEVQDNLIAILGEVKDGCHH